MSGFARGGWAAGLISLAVAAGGCGGPGAAVRRQTDVTLGRLRAARRVEEDRATVLRGGSQGLPRLPADKADPPPASRPAIPSGIWLAPAETSDAPAGDAPDDARWEAPAGQDVAAPSSLEGRPVLDILKRDLRQAPESLWSGTKQSFGNCENLVFLGVVFGGDRVVRHNLDSEVRRELHNNDTSLAETGDFGTVVGNPALHFGIAGAWYLASVHYRDDRHHRMSTTMIEALAVNGLSTMLLKVSMDDETPNDEEFGWPSGHTSSSVCFASVMHAYYGWKVGLPLYALAGYVAASRLEDREHDLSDVIFGAALGYVTGHSIATGKMPRLGRFDVLPYAGHDAGGVMLVTRW